MSSENESDWEAWWTAYEKDPSQALVHGDQNAYNPLQMAILYDYDRVVSWILNKGHLTLDSYAPNTLSPLLIAVSEGSLSALSAILAFAERLSADELERLLAQRSPPDDRVVHLGQAVSLYLPGGQSLFHLIVDRHQTAVLARLRALSLPDSGHRLSSPALRAALARLVLSPDASQRSALDIAVLLAALAPSAKKQEACAQLVAGLSSLAALPAPPPQPSREQAAAAVAASEQATRCRALEAEKRRAAESLALGNRAIAALYRPLHADVYQRLELASEDWLRKVERPVEGYGVWTAPALSEACCRRLLEELLHYEACARGMEGRGEARGADRSGDRTDQLLLPLFVRHDGNMGSLERCGFQPLLDLIHEKLMQPVLRACFPHLPPVRTRHAFLTRNWFGREELFRKHRDASDITLNICLQKSEPCHGSTVMFFSEEDNQIPVLDYDHHVGHMAIHSGKEWHQTQPLLGPPDARRCSLIVWADIIT